jgi:CHASE2 domain-containing sensor protein
MKRLFKNKNILTIIISCIIVLILLLTSSFFRVLNKSIQNNYYDIKNEIVGLSANPHIVIVEMDDESFETIG